jgi:hypothetical protein
MTQIKFYNLDEARQYRPECPLCHGRMRPDVSSINFDFKHDYQRITAKFDLGDVSFEADCYSNELLAVTYDRTYDKVYTLGSSPNYAGMTPHSRSLRTAGLDMVSMGMACSNEKCWRYRYVVQVHVSIDKHKLMGLVLNSETIVVENMAKLYTIRNIYTTDKTEMEVRHAHVSHLHESQSKIEYPLIPLNIEEPMKTVERLKNLTVFL